MYKPLLVLLVFIGFSSFSQELDELPDPDPKFMTDEYELIILDGDTVLRSKVTKEIYNKRFRKRGTATTFSADWMNVNWDTKIFNPYKNEAPPTWPVTLSFKGEQFTMPVEGPVTSRFGWRRGAPHRGIDIDLVTGDNVMAAMSGKIRFAKYYSGFGNCVVIRHQNGLETIYAHLSKILVKPNDYVYSGQVIGKGGNTGRSRGSHLHFEARWFNKAINPEYLFDFENTKFFTATDIVIDELWADPRKHRSYKKSKIVVKRPTSTNDFYNPTTNTSTVASIDNQQNTTTFETTTAKTNDTFRKEDDQNSFQKNSSSTSNFEKTAVSTEYHIVESGDTLAKIANKYKTSIDNLLVLNGLKRTGVLRIGQSIRIK